jgi:hypothetical protein
MYALKLARHGAERITGPLAKRPLLVADDGPPFIAQRLAEFVRELYIHIEIQYLTPKAVGAAGTVSSEAEDRGSLLPYENSEHTCACLGEFNVRYTTVRPHWVLVPEEGGDSLVPAELCAGGRAIQILRWQDWARAASARFEKLLKAVA